MTIGAGKPIVVLNSGDRSSCSTMTSSRRVLAHEVGHILSDHVLYRTALPILLRLGTRAPADRRAACR